MLPDKGDWTVTVSAYDAQNKPGPAAVALNVTTTVDAYQVRLPFVSH
jgi:hypothetical protein